jgi:hypothetical protein
LSNRRLLLVTSNRVYAVTLLIVKADLGRDIFTTEANCNLQVVNNEEPCWDVSNLAVVPFCALSKETEPVGF